MDGVDLVLAAQEGRSLDGIQAAGSSDGAQHRVIADIVAVAEMRGEQGFRHFCRASKRGCPADQAVGVDAAGRAADPIEAERHAFGVADLGDRIIETSRSILATEFADNVIRAGHAEPGHVRIEEEWTPGQLIKQVWTAPHGAE